MKIIIKYLTLSALSLMFICLFGFTADAQPRIVNQEHLDEALAKHKSLQTGRNARIITLWETLINDVTDMTKRTVEYSGNNSRTTTEWKENGKHRMTEIVKIDGKEYTKDNLDTSSRMKVTRTITDRKIIVDTNDVAKDQCDLRQIVKEDVVLNGKQTVLFIDTLVNRGHNGIQKTETKRWFDESGLLLKAEYKNENLLHRLKSQRTTTTYEYDVELKIEPPIQ